MLHLTRALERPVLSSWSSKPPQDPIFAHRLPARFDFNCGVLAEISVNTLNKRRGISSG